MTEKSDSERNIPKGLESHQFETPTSSELHAYLDVLVPSTQPNGRPMPLKEQLEIALRRVSQAEATLKKVGDLGEIRAENKIGGEVLVYSRVEKLHEGPEVIKVWKVEMYGKNHPYSIRAINQFRGWLEQYQKDRDRGAADWEGNTEYVLNHAVEEQLLKREGHGRVIRALLPQKSPKQGIRQKLRSIFRRDS